MASFIFEEAFSSLFPILDHVRIPSWYLMFQILLALGRPWLPIWYACKWCDYQGGAVIQILYERPYSSWYLTQQQYMKRRPAWHMEWVWMSDMSSGLFFLSPSTLWSAGGHSIRNIGIPSMGVSGCDHCPPQEQQRWHRQRRQQQKQQDHHHQNNTAMISWY